MSGHSKWSKVKHQKAVTDVNKAKNFTKASRAIAIAVKEGGNTPDPDKNFKLRLAVEKAREVNMPKETIERAIAKAAGGDGINIESLLYEAIGPNGSALLIEATTENRQRTVSQIKSVLDHNGGVLAAPGAVSFQFKKQAMIELTRPQNSTEDSLTELALESGADDIAIFDKSVELYADPTLLESVRKKVSEKNLGIISSDVYYYPTVPLEISEEGLEKLQYLIELLEELDDIQTVFANVKNL